MNFGKNFKQYLKFFLPWIIVFVVLLVPFVLNKLGIIGRHEEKYVSTNTERVYGEQRIFDNADMLTDDEEEKLAEIIAQAEYDTGLDIVIVTLNESLKPYGDMYLEKYGIYVPTEKYVMVYADEFWENNGFGYNCAQVLDGKTTTGDGVILVDNVYREEETGRIYTWMGTTGKGEELYSSSMIDRALDKFYDYVDYDYYMACKAYVAQVVSDVTPLELNGAAPATVIVIIVMLIFFFTNLRSKAGKVTTRNETYLIGRKPSFPVMVNTFKNKTVTKRYNPPTSSSSGGSGGGGHHISGGGGSHGGGGHSR